MAAAFNVPLANGGAWQYHNMHLQAGLANGGLVEMHYLADELYKQIYRGLPVPKDGWLTLPDALTVAGGGNSTTGDGGPATSSRLFAPSGLAIDRQGNLLVAEEGASRIRKVSPAGIITTVAGAGLSTAKRKSWPQTATPSRPCNSGSLYPHWSLRSRRRPRFGESE
jgi:hypothetical protein